MHMSDTITNDKRDQAYIEATDQQRYLYANPESGQRLWTIAEKFSLTEDVLYTKFVILVGDVVLGLVERAELQNLLPSTLNIDTKTAAQIVTDLLVFLEQTPPTLSSNVLPDLESEIAETEAALSSVPSIRTMPKDVAKIQPQTENTYSSTQEAILKEGRAESKDTEPRWGDVTR